MSFKIRQSIILLCSICCINDSYCMEGKKEEYKESLINNNQNQINLEINEKDKNNIQNIKERIEKAINYLNIRITDYYSHAKITYISPVSRKGRGLLSVDDTFYYIDELYKISNNIENNKDIISDEQIKQIKDIEDKINTDFNKKNEILQKEELEQKSKENINTKKMKKFAKKKNNTNNNSDMERKVKEQEQEMKEIFSHTVSIDSARKYMLCKNSNGNIKLFFQELVQTADEIIKNNRVPELKLLRNYFKNEYGINKDTNTWEQKFAYCLAFYIDRNIYGKKSKIFDTIFPMLDNNTITHSQYNSLLKLLLYTDYIACLSQKSVEFNKIDELIRDNSNIILRKINNEYYKDIILRLIKPILKHRISNELEKFSIEDSKENQELRYKSILKFAFEKLKSIFVDSLAYAILPAIEQYENEQNTIQKKSIDEKKEYSNENQISIEQNEQSKINKIVEKSNINQYVLLDKIKKQLQNNTTINECILQVLSLPEYCNYIRKCCNDISTSNEKLSKNTISLLKGIEDIKCSNSNYTQNDNVLIFCKYIVKELNSLINKRIHLNIKKYGISEYLFYDILLRCDYTLYNINTDMFYRYIKELYNDKSISRDEYRAGLDFLLYKKIISADTYLSDILSSYVAVLLPTDKKDWENIIDTDIKKNRTKQNSILTKEIANNLIKQIKYWEIHANNVCKNDYLNIGFRDIPQNKINEKYIIDKILINNTNYDIYYNIALNKRNTLHEFYTLLSVFKKYNRSKNNTLKKSNDNKIEKDNEYSISKIVDNFYKLHIYNQNINNTLFPTNANGNIIKQINNTQKMPDNPLKYILKYTLSSVLTTEQKVYILSNLIHQLTESKYKYSEIIENYINNIIKFCNSDYKNIIIQEIKNNDDKIFRQIMDVILQITINKDNTIEDLININKSLQVHLDNLEKVHISISSESINSVKKLIYILEDFISKFDLIKNSDIRKLTLKDILNKSKLNEVQKEEKNRIIE